MDVPLAKYFISPGSLHGSVPFFPIPFDVVAATIAVNDLGAGIGASVVIVV